MFILHHPLLSLARDRAVNYVDFWVDAVKLFWQSNYWGGVLWAGQRGMSQIGQADFSMNSKHKAFPVGLQKKTSLCKRLGLVHNAQVCNKLMTRSVLNAQSLDSTKTQSRAQYCLFVMVSFIISHCKRNFCLDPYQCLHNFFLIPAPCTRAQSPLSPVQVLLYVRVPKHSVPMQLLWNAALFFLLRHW